MLFDVTVSFHTMKASNAYFNSVKQTADCECAIRPILALRAEAGWECENEREREACMQCKLKMCTNVWAMRAEFGNTECVL